MKKIIGAILIMLLSTSLVLAEVTFKATRKDIKGNVLERTFFQNDQEIAKRIYNNKGGLVKASGEIPDGPAKSYHKKGKVERVAAYKNGELNGKTQCFDQKGTLLEEGTYSAGKLTGTYTWYHENGKVKQTANFKNGKLEDVSRWYTKKGKLEAEARFRNGKVVSEKRYTAP